jgi:hypothetical protein
LRRFPEVEDVAGAVEFLLSDKARNITGIVLTVDADTTAPDRIDRDERIRFDIRCPTKGG